MKVGYVIHRYGAEIHGGAEQACRSLAERLGARPGWDVEVFTTCARGVDWENEYPPGDETIGGVPVHRFPSQAGRHPGFDDFSTSLLVDPRGASADQQQRWVDLQGPVNPDLVDAAVASDADLLVFTPYLYAPTVHGVTRARHRAVLQPAAHEEPPIHLPVYEGVFGGARGLVYYSDAERRVVERIFPVAATPHAVVGLGVEPGEGDVDGFRVSSDLGDRPYLVCLGRVDEGKGSETLARFFAAYKDRHPGPLALAFVGPVVHRPPPHPDIVVTGAVDDALWWGAIRGATAVVSPSAFESFSIVLLEGWSAGVPALVNGACAVTREHARRSGGGLWFSGYASFEAAVDRLARDPELASALGGAGRHYVASHFDWGVLTDRYAAFLSSLG